MLQLLVQNLITVDPDHVETETSGPLGAEDSGARFASELLALDLPAAPKTSAEMGAPEFSDTEIEGATDPDSPNRVEQTAEFQGAEKRPTPGVDTNQIAPIDHGSTALAAELLPSALGTRTEAGTERASVRALVWPAQDTTGIALPAATAIDQRAHTSNPTEAPLRSLALAAAVGKQAPAADTSEIPQMSETSMPLAKNHEAGTRTLPQEREDDAMQLSRPNRLRTHAAALAAARLTGVDVAASNPPETPDAIEPVRPTMHSDQRLHPARSAPDIGPNPSPDHRSPHRPDPQMQVTREEITVPRQSPAIPPPIDARAVATNPQPMPLQQVAGAYTSLSPAVAIAPANEGTSSPMLGINPDQDAALPLMRPDAVAPPLANVPSASAVPSPSHIAAQLTQIATTPQLQGRDIVLSPEELGRVRMSVQVQDSAIHVAILVERPETLDLMRRTIATLGADLRALGYQDVSFGFEQRGGSAGTTNSQDQATDDQPVGANDVEETPPSHIATGQLDLRI